jgi:hypothetical protein
MTKLTTLTVDEQIARLERLLAVRRLAVADIAPRRELGRRIGGAR